jgi:hypothetical protein
VNNAETERKKYLRAGRVNWVRFIPWLFIIFVASIILACMMNFAYRYGHYYVVIFPMVCGIIIGGLLFLAVQLGHCRSRLVAALTGLLAGTVLYLGQYQAGLASEFGLQAIPRVDLLPDYIRYRMNSDIIQDADRPRATGYKNGSGKTNGDDSEDPPQPVRDSLSGKTIENWITFAFEFLCVLFFTTAFGYFRSKKAFCERCGKWMAQEFAVFLPDLGANFLAAFNSGKFSAITTARLVPMLKNTPYTGAAIDFCAPIAGRASGCPIYFSIKEVRASTIGQPAQFDNARGKTFLDRVELSSAEIAGLASRFPSLTSVAGIAPAAEFSSAPAAPASGLSMAQPVVSVQIRNVTGRAADKILSRKNVLIGNALTLCVLAIFFAGMGAILGGAFLLIPGDSQAAFPHPGLRIASGVALILLGLPAAILGALTGLRNGNMWSNRRYLSLCRRAFRRRAERMLDLDDPDLIFVESVPRKNWGRIMLDNADDIGFLRIDPQRREVLFEGDNECIRIPADAILSCEVEEIPSVNNQVGSVIHQMTVIQARRDAGIWEMSFAHRWTSWSVNNRKRLTKAMEIRRRVLTLNPAMPA